MERNEIFRKALLIAILAGAGAAACEGDRKPEPETQAAAPYGIQSGDEVGIAAQQSTNGVFLPVQNQGPTTGAGGNAMFSITGDDFAANLNLTGLAPDTVSPQAVREGTRCPTPADDTNNDGWVDAVEGAAVAGKRLVPLDDNLAQQNLPPPVSPQIPGLQGLYPVTDANGAYNYTRNASYAQLLDDLHQPDADPNDGLAKLPGGAPLNIADRVVIVQGLPPDTPLPPTVQSIDGLPAYATVPVACAELDGLVSGPTPGPGGSPGSTPGPTPTGSPGLPSSPTPSPTATPTPTATATPTPTATPTATPTPPATATPGGTPGSPFQPPITRPPIDVNPPISQPPAEGGPAGG